MATKKPKAPQRLTKNQQELKILAKAGIYGGDWKNARVASGQQKRLRAKFAGQLAELKAGKLRAVKVPKNAKLPSDVPKAKGKVFIRVVKGERPRFNKKTGLITSGTVYIDGVKFRKVIIPDGIARVGDLPRAKGMIYQVPFKQMGIESPKFEDPQELARFMADYEDKPGGKPGRFPDWLDYVVAYEITDKRLIGEVDLYDA